MSSSRTTARDLAQIAIFAALIAALGLPGAITIGGLGVPITLQTLGVMLAGGVLGARKGLLAVVVFQVLMTAGLPLLAGGRGGLGVWTGPTAGYLIGWLPGVFIIGLLTARLLPRYPFWSGLLVNLLGGVVVIHICGITVLSLRVGLGPALANGTLPYLPGDVAKAVITTLVVKQVHRAYPGLIPVRAGADRTTAGPTS